MRNLTLSETLNTSGGNTVITTGAVLIGTAAIFLFLSCYTKRNCGWSPMIVDNKFFLYEWHCK